jgi:hypothetical protein
LWSGGCCSRIGQYPLFGVFQRFAPPLSAKKRFFNDNCDKTDNEQGKNNPYHNAYACTDTEKLFICHWSPRRLYALQRLICRSFRRSYTVIQPDAAIGIAGQNQPRMRFE